MHSRRSLRRIFRSGQSIFSRPKPIDLSSVRRRPYALDIDMDAEDPASEELSRSLIRDPVVFDANEEQRAPAAATPMPRAVQAAQDRDAEDMWAELG